MFSPLAEEVMKMADRPEGLEVAAIDDSPVEAEEMYVVALGEYGLVVAAGNVDGGGIGVGEFAKGEGKARARHAETLFDDAAAIADLAF